MTEYQNLLAYCRNCTDNQLCNVLTDELKRSKIHSGEIAETAKEFYRAAREECARRNINPDEVLNYA